MSKTSEVFPGQIRTLKTLVNDFAFAFPLRMALMVCTLILAGFLESVSMMAVLPLISLAVGEAQSGSVLEGIVADGLGAFGLKPTLAVLLGVICLAMASKAAALLWAHRQVGYTVAHVTADLRSRFIKALIAARWTLFTQQPTGEIVNSLSTETQRAANAFGGLCQSFSLAIQALAYFILAFAVSFDVALAAVIAGAMVTFALNHLVKLSRDVGRQQTELTQAMMGRITEGLHGLKPLKVMGLEGWLGHFLEDKINRLRVVAGKTVFYRGALSTLLEPLFVVFLALGILFAHAVLKVPFSVQMMMALLFFRLITRLGSIQQTWQKVMVAESAYFAFKNRLMAAEHAGEPLTKGIFPVLPAPIHVENVDYSYTSAQVLKDLSLVIRPNEITAIIGASGAGKTTLADLIVGLYKPMHGRIRVGEVDLSEIDMKRWRESIGYVPQELFLFNQDLMANVALGDPNIGEEQVIACLKDAGAWDFAKDLPQGIHTVVGEKGARLSGGQCQRIAIARALVRNPALLILDEATTALDPDTEHAICETINRLKQGRSILAITHQPAWASIADRVYRLKDGQMEDAGAARLEKTKFDKAAPL